MPVTRIGQLLGRPSKKERKEGRKEGRKRERRKGKREKKKRKEYELTKVSSPNGMGREGIRIWRSFLYRHRAAPVFGGGRRCWFYTTRVLLPENRQISGLCAPIHVDARLHHRKRYETGKPEGGRRGRRIVETFSSARTDLDPYRNSRLVFPRISKRGEMDSSIGK